MSKWTEITVGEILEKFKGYIKVIYKEKVIYDNTDTNPYYIEMLNNLAEEEKMDESIMFPPYKIFNLIEKYKNELVGKFIVDIDHYHHFIIDIIE